jgi:hypothetical protein
VNSNFACFSFDEKDENLWETLIFKPGAAIVTMVVILSIMIVAIVFGVRKLMLFLPEYQTYKFPIGIILYDLTLSIGNIP